MMGTELMGVWKSARIEPLKSLFVRVGVKLAYCSMLSAAAVASKVLRVDEFGVPQPATLYATYSCAN